MSDYTESVAYSSREPAWSGLINAKAAIEKTKYCRFELIKSKIMPMVINEVGNAITQRKTCCAVDVGVFSSDYAEQLEAIYHEIRKLGYGLTANTNDGKTTLIINWKDL